MKHDCGESTIPHNIDEPTGSVVWRTNRHRVVRKVTLKSSWRDHLINIYPVTHITIITKLFNVWYSLATKSVFPSSFSLLI